MYLSAMLPKVPTLCWMNRERVSADAHTPIQFSILSSNAEPPWLSTRSATRTCSGREQQSSVMNIKLHTKKRRPILLML